MSTKARERITKALESDQLVRVIPEGKTCATCGDELSYDNITPKRTEVYAWHCDDCVRLNLSKIGTSYKYSKESDEYSIKRSKVNAAPRIMPKELDAKKQNLELLNEFIKNTDQFRIDSMIKIMFSKRVAPKDKKIAINYLLKAFDKLTPRQCVQVINCTHELIASEKTPADIRVKLAIEIRAFMGADKKTKEQAVKSYEDMLLDSDGASQ